jgi:magnesium transporter
VTVVPYRADIKDIMDAFTSSPHRKVVVLDKDGSVLGIIYADDALDLFQGKSTQTLYQFAGVKGSERPFDTVFEKVSHRYKWLIINLATAFLAASVVSLFKDTLSQLVILAAYMPIVAGMGGNAGTQTLAVIVRGIAVGEIDLKNGLSAIRREASAGFVNGIVVGVIVAIVATLWNGNPMLGLVIGLAMVVNLVVAGFFGALVPLIMKRLGKDPATSATIFITTATDVLGFFCFLGLASLLLL